MIHGPWWLTRIFFQNKGLLKKLRVKLKKKTLLRLSQISEFNKSVIIPETLNLKCIHFINRILFITIYFSRPSRFLTPTEERKWHQHIHYTLFFFVKNPRMFSFRAWKTFWNYIFSNDLINSTVFWSCVAFDLVRRSQIHSFSFATVLRLILRTAVRLVLFLGTTDSSVLLY